VQKPAVVRPEDEVTTVGTVFGAPLVVKGRTWLPLTELALWVVMAWVAGRGRPDRSWGKRLGIGALTTAVILGSEWCHNLAHAAAARCVGRPMDALRVTWGMPLVVYYDVQDESVSPQQHLVRALGGPVFNALLLPVALLLRRAAKPGSGLRDAADAALGMNTFLSTASLLPIPGIDGGPILKWSLVQRGYTRGEADRLVASLDRVLAPGLGVAAAMAFRGRRRLLGSILGLFAVLSAALGFGLIKEQE
jgi:Zn-dependent protease